MTLILVSEKRKVKYPKRFERMTSKRNRGETLANKRAGADATPTLRNHWWTSPRLYPSSLAISRTERPLVRRRPILAACAETHGLPSLLPFANLLNQIR